MHKLKYYLGHYEYLLAPIYFILVFAKEIVIGFVHAYYETKVACVCTSRKLKKYKE